MQFRCAAPEEVRWAAWEAARVSGDFAAFVGPLVARLGVGDAVGEQACRPRPAPARPALDARGGRGSAFARRARASAVLSLPTTS
jgi:hypothetical protein